MLPTNGDKKISKYKSPIHNTRNVLCMGCECTEFRGSKIFSKVHTRKNLLTTHFMGPNYFLVGTL